MSEASTHEARLLKLEEKIAYQDKIIAELNEVVVTLSRSVDGMQKRLDSLELAIRGELGAREQPNEKPPHY